MAVKSGQDGLRERGNGTAPQVKSEAQPQPKEGVRPPENEERDAAEEREDQAGADRVHGSVEQHLDEKTAARAIEKPGLH